MDDDDDTITPSPDDDDNKNKPTTTSKPSTTNTNNDDNNKHSTPNSPTTTQIEAALYLATFLLTSSLTLSFLSSYDCTLLHLTLPSTTPLLNTLFSTEDNPLYLGLWSFSSPFKPGECLFYNVARESRVTVETEFYIEGGGMLFNGDLMFGMARVGGFGAVVGGFVCNIMTWRMVYSKSILYQKSFLVLQILTLLLEGLKLISFTNIQLCSRPFFLTNNNDPNNPIYEPVERCSWSRASFASLVAICQYLIAVVITFVKLFAVRNSIGKSYSNLTLPSVGESMMSVTGGSNGNNTGSGNDGGGASSPSSPSTNRDNNNNPSTASKNGGRDMSQFRGAMSMMGFSTAAGFDVGGMSDEEEEVVEEKEEENKPMVLENRRRARKQSMLKEKEERKNELSSEMAPLRRSMGAGGSVPEDDLWLDDSLRSQGRNVRFSSSTKEK